MQGSVSGSEWGTRSALTKCIKSVKGCCNQSPSATERNRLLSVCCLETDRAVGCVPCAVQFEDEDEEGDDEVAEIVDTDDDASEQDEEAARVLQGTNVDVDEDGEAGEDWQAFSTHQHSVCPYRTVSSDLLAALHCWQCMAPVHICFPAMYCGG